MKKGLNRYEYFLEQLELLLQKSSAEENPAWWLYKNNARTPLFMLEALSRIYVEILEKKPFKKFKAQFKSFEDAIGRIDMYDGFANEFSQKPAIYDHVKEYFYKKTEAHVDNLNEMLLQEGWLNADGKRIKKIRKKLNKIDWLNDKKEIKAIHFFYETAIEEIKSFFDKHKNGFTDLEDQLHEIRRLLRWLSINAHALRGAVQLIDSGFNNSLTLNYITDAVEKSPYNKLPEVEDNRYVVLLDKTVFLTMSGLIDQLGTFKDNGLRVMLLAEAIQQSRQVNSNLALLGAYELLESDGDELQKVLNNATSACKPFFEDELLDKLLQGIGTATDN
ncbi:MAG: hypothetical protein ABIW38_12570 [Ferruginibacter sp.]